jgi:hypothetical protein
MVAHVSACIASQLNAARSGASDADGLGCERRVVAAKGRCGEWYAAAIGEGVVSRLLISMQRRTAVGGW